MEIRSLGCGRDYSTTLELQHQLVQERLDGKIPDTLLLLEHAPVYTIGRTRDQSSLRELSALPHPVVEISRGGKATYHGPGQLTGYLICDLTQRSKDLHRFLRDIEEAIILSSKHFGVPATSREGLTGVWTETRKLASIGVGVRKWISLHGFAINVTPQSISGFAYITPCGLDGVSMTSLHQEGAPQSLTCEAFGRQFARDFLSLSRP